MEVDEFSLDLSLAQMFAKFSNMLTSLKRVPGISPVYLFGHNPNILGAEEQTVWPQRGLYQYPEIALSMTISSTSDNDTAGGSGARSVIIEGLVGDGGVFEQEFPMAGQTPVAIPTDLLRFNNGAVEDVGALGTNEGDIRIGAGTVTAGIPDDVYGIIGEGDGEALMCVYTVPAGHVGRLMSAYATVTKNSNPSLRLVTRKGLGKAFRTRGKFVGADNPVFRKLDFAGVLPPMADIEIRGSALSGNFALSADMEILVIDPETLLGR